MALLYQLRSDHQGQLVGTKHALAAQVSLASSQDLYQALIGVDPLAAAKMSLGIQDLFIAHLSIFEVRNHHKKVQYRQHTYTNLRRVTKYQSA